jgi:predicted DNA binding CopG/RHH family protein
MTESILTRFSKEQVKQLKAKAKEKGLPKSTFIRLVTLKAIQDGSI